MVACVTAISFRFLGGEIEQASKQADKQRRAPGVMKKLGESGRDGFVRSFGPFACMFWKRVLLDEYLLINAHDRWLIDE